MSAVHAAVNSDIPWYLDFEGTLGQRVPSLGQPQVLEGYGWELNALPVSLVGFVPWVESMWCAATTRKALGKVGRVIRLFWCTPRIH